MNYMKSASSNGESGQEIATHQESAAYEKQAIEWVGTDTLTVVDLPKNAPLENLRGFLNQLSQRPGTHIVFAAGRKVTTEEFTSIFPRGSIAGDGVLDGPTGVFPAYANFDHHDSHGDAGDRLSQAAMCEQVFHSIDYQSFQRNLEHQNGMVILVNHFDPDNATAIANLMLLNEEDEEKKLTSEQKRKLYELSSFIGAVDAYGGCLDIPQVDAERIKWTTRPLTDARRNDWLLLKKSAAEKLKIFQDYLDQIRLYIDGTAGSLPLETEFEVLQDDPDFPLIREIGSDARWLLATKGVRRFATDRGSYNGTGRRLLSVVNVEGKAEERDLFPTTEMYPIFNRLEAIDPAFYQEPIERQVEAAMRLPVSPTKPWGGNGIGGSFEGGSRLADNFPAYARAVRTYLYQQREIIRLEQEAAASHMEAVSLLSLSA